MDFFGKQFRRARRQARVGAGEGRAMQMLMCLRPPLSCLENSTHILICQEKKVALNSRYGHTNDCMEWIPELTAKCGVRLIGR